MKHPYWFIAFVLIALLFIFRECEKSVPETKVVTRTVIKKGDSIPYKVEIIKKEPVYIYRDTGSIQWREMEIDTMAILADYFASYHYLDTLMNDTSAFISLRSHVHQNQLFYDELMFQNRREKVIHTTTITHYYHPPGRLYLSLGAGRNPDEFDMPVGLLYLGPKRLGLGGQYGLMTGDVYVSAYVKIGWGNKPVTPR